MHRKITRPKVKNMIQKANGKPVEISLCPKGKDINHPFMCTHMQVNLTSMEQLDEIIATSWVKSFGTHEPPQLCIWEDEEE